MVPACRAGRISAQLEGREQSSQREQRDDEAAHVQTSFW
jgi:hypothetical protein